MVGNVVFETLEEVLWVMRFIRFKDCDPKIRKMSVNFDGVIGNFKVASGSLINNVDRGGGDTTTNKGITLATIGKHVIIPKVLSRKPGSGFFITADKRMNVLTELAFKDLDMLRLREEKTIKGEGVRDTQESSLITNVVPRTDRLMMVGSADGHFTWQKVRPSTSLVKQ